MSFSRVQYAGPVAYFRVRHEAGMRAPSRSGFLVLAHPQGVWAPPPPPIGDATSWGPARAGSEQVPGEGKGPDLAALGAALQAGPAPRPHAHRSPGGHSVAPRDLSDRQTDVRTDACTVCPRCHLFRLNVTLISFTRFLLFFPKKAFIKNPFLRAGSSHSFSPAGG